jgi:hypothetical protein
MGGMRKGYRGQESSQLGGMERGAGEVYEILKRRNAERLKTGKLKN